MLGSCPIVIFCSGGHDIKGTRGFFLWEEIRLLFGDDEKSVKTKALSALIYQYVQNPGRAYEEKPSQIISKKSSQKKYRYATFVYSDTELHMIWKTLDYYQITWNKWPKINKISPTTNLASIKLSRRYLYDKAN